MGYRSSRYSTRPAGPLTHGPERSLGTERPVVIQVRPLPPAPTVVQGPAPGSLSVRVDGKGTDVDEPAQAAVLEARFEKIARGDNRVQKRIRKRLLTGTSRQVEDDRKREFALVQVLSEGLADDRLIADEVKQIVLNLECDAQRKPEYSV